MAKDNSPQVDYKSDYHQLKDENDKLHTRVAELETKGVKLTAAVNQTAKNYESIHKEIGTITALIEQDKMFDAGFRMKTLLAAIEEFYKQNIETLK